MMSLNTLLSIACVATAGGITFVGQQEELTRNPVKSTIAAQSQVSNFRVLGTPEPVAVTVTERAPERPSGRPLDNVRVFGPAAEQIDVDVRQAIDRFHGISADALMTSADEKTPRPSTRRPKTRKHSSNKDRNANRRSVGRQSGDMIQRTRFQTIKAKRAKQWNERRHDRTPLSKIRSSSRTGRSLVKRKSFLKKTRLYKENGSVHDRLRNNGGKNYLRRYSN